MNKASAWVIIGLLVCSTFSMFVAQSVQSISPSIRGVEWTKYSSNPLTTLSSVYANPYVLFDGTMYKMWYLQEDFNIGYATSTDGITWQEFGTVLPKGTRGQPDEWEASMVGNPWVLYTGTEYLMWYHGYVDYPSGDGFSQIGYAWSEDGISWTKYGSPVLARGSGGWDTYGVFDPTVILDGSTYKMWYIGRAGSGSSPYYIGYATSIDGIEWTRYGGNPVMAAGGNGGWDDWSISGGMSVVKTGNTYLMWYSGRSSTQWQIGLACSNDGISWQKYSNNPVLEMGSAGSWDSIYVTEPTVLQVGNTYKMWYMGRDGTPQKKLGLACAGTKWAVVIGVNEYYYKQDNGKGGPVYSARDFYDVLINDMGFQTSNAHLLVDEVGNSADDVTYEVFMEQLIWLQSVASADDIVVFYYAGHGGQDTSSGHEELLTHVGSIFDDDFSSEIDNIGSQNIVVILDISHSGGFIIDDGLWSDLAAGTPPGRIVLTACEELPTIRGLGWLLNRFTDATELPFNHGQFEMVFTHFLVKAFRGEGDINSDGKVSVEEAFDFAYGQIFLKEGETKLPGYLRYFNWQKPQIYDGYPDYGVEGEFFLE